jgi:Zn-dependent protease with chaperone function
MNLEPQVLESIDRNRRKVLYEELLVLTPVVLIIAAVVFLIMFAFKRNVGIAAIVMLAIAIAIALILTYSVGKSFKRFVKPAEEFKPVSLELFQEQLDAVSIGAGIETPELVVLDVPSINSVAFTRRGKPAVGVTKRAVEHPFSKEEAEAIMAHEVAHILINDILKPLDAWHLKTLPFILLAALALLAIPVVWIAASSHSRISTAMVVLSIIFFIWVGTISDFIIRRLDIARRHNDFLADSIAAKLTSNPGALRQAIRHLDAILDHAIELPLDNYSSRHLFICPHNLTKHQKANMSLRDAMFMYGTSEKTTDELLDREKEAIGWRIRNLDAIENGHWPAFS